MSFNANIPEDCDAYDPDEWEEGVMTSEAMETGIIPMRRLTPAEVQANRKLDERITLWEAEQMAKGHPI